MKSSRTLVTLISAALMTVLTASAWAIEPLVQVPESPRLRMQSPAADSGWLGIQLAPVPAAVAAQLQLGEDGVMVRNLFKDSPADRAGLDRYDVIVSLNGQKIDGGMEMFSSLVRDTKPGDELTLSLYRGGQQQEVTVVAGSMPRRLDERNLKYEDDPDVAHRRLFGLRGKILRPGPDGWILDDLGELPELPSMEGFFERSPAPGQAEGDQEPETAEPQEGRRVDARGEVLQVRKNPDGTVEVRRYRSGTPMEEAEVKQYENLDQLRQDDPEAAELIDSLKGAPSDENQKLHREPRVPRIRPYDMRPDMDALRQYQDALREYMERYRRDADRRVPPPPAAPRWRPWGERFGPQPGDPPVRPLRPAPREPLPEARFEVHPDGSITAQVEDGPTQLNMTFPNEKEFEQKAPKLYERYKETLQKTR